MTITEIYTKNYPYLVRFARKRFPVLDNMETEDLVQDAFVKVLSWMKNGHSIIEGKEIQYIIQCIYSVYIDKYRKAAKYPLVFDEINDQKMERTYTPHLGLDEEYIVSNLIKMDVKASQVLFHTIEGYSYKELSKKYQKNPITLRVDVHRLCERARRSKVFTALLTLLLPLVLMIGCTNPECPEVVCPDCKDCLTTSQIDSAYAEQRQTLDSLQQLALQEVTDYRNQSIYQIDTMRQNFLTWQEQKVADLNAWKDSIAGLHVYDNTIIKGDTLHQTEVYFDENGKPALRIF